MVAAPKPMGSIQNKRGSARQAPPQTYVPFVDGSPETPDVLKATCRYLKGVLIILLLLILIGVTYMALGKPKSKGRKPSWPGPFHDCGK